MASDRIDVRHVATLARLALSEDEVALYGAQLANLLTYVDELKDLDTASVAATAQVVESRNVLRDDVQRPGLTRDEALAGAPQAQNGFFRVPKIIAAAE
jgi:aspartyl-tRNA(Asn)/glutamyl-tRNA(Gln) amidotransferase subunit C